MISQFHNYINEHNLWQPEDRLLVAVSGGIDSVVLCHLLYCSDIEFAIAHCNFGLRGEDSELDEIFVRQLAAKYNVEIFVKKFDTQAYAQERQHSIQMAARALRYEWFQELIENHGFQYLVTAHHLNDSLETVLLNIAKGTGIAGVRGILPKKNNVVRPLLFASKKNLQDYAASQQLSWREDISNESTKYHRNLIRKEVVPILKQINPNLEATFVNTIERLSATEEILKLYISDVTNKYVVATDNLVIVDIREISNHPQFSLLLFELLNDYGFSWVDAQDIAKSKRNGAKHFFSPSHQIVKYAHQLRIFSLPEENDHQPEWIDLGDVGCSIGNTHIDIFYPAVEDISFSKNNLEVYFDIDQLHFPLQVRPWQNGDKFQPSGMNGLKKISDYLIDEKIPLDKKENISVMLSGDTIIWVVGMRAAHVARINKQTSNVIRLNCI